MSPSAPRHTGLNLYKFAVQAVRDARYSSMYARVHNARVIKIMREVHGDLPVFLKKHPNAPLEEYAFKEAVAGDYGAGLGIQGAIEFLEEGAGIDGYNEDRHIDAFVEL